MPSSAPKKNKLPAHSTAAPDALQLEVLSDDDELPIDEELVLATDELDDEELDGHHVRQKKRSRFSLPPITLGRKNKGKYSRVTAEHTAASAASKAALPVVQPPNGSRATQSTAASYSPTESSAAGFDDDPKPCLTLVNVCLFIFFCVTIVLAGYVGYVIGRRSLSNSAVPTPPPRLIVLSIDGFASNYFDLYPHLLPHLTSLTTTGLSALPLTPVFPSSTFPNHYTLVTGLYPPQHGIVANGMYNASSDEWFVAGPNLTQASYWWQGEPVWATAQKAGLSSAVLNWPGSDRVIAGRRPDVWSPYNGNLSDSERVGRLMEWLDGDNCTLCMLYFSTVDSVGHEFGPLSAEMGTALSDMDAIVGSVINGLQARRLWDSVNLMIVSDHGMTSVNTTNSPDNELLVLIDQYTNVTDYTLVYYGPFAHILPHSNATGALLYADLKQNLRPTTDPIAPARNTTSCTAYYRDDPTAAIPPAYHYSFTDSARIQPIVLVCDLGVIVTNSSLLLDERGAHGYLPDEAGMGAVLLVHGVGVGVDGRNVSLQGVQSVDVYGLMCQLLGMKAAVNVGNMQQFLPYLRR